MSRRRAAVPAEPPDDLGAEEWNALARWVAQKEPWAMPRLGDLVANCLDHHRARQNAGGIVNWVAACRLWIRNEREWRGGARSGAAGKASGGGGGRGDVAAAARLAFSRQRGLFGDSDPGPDW